MITSNLVPCGKDTIYQMLKDKKNGKTILDTDWSGCGKPRIVDNSTMADIITDLHNETGRTFGKEDVNKLIIKHCNKKVTTASHIPLNFDENSSHLYCTTTLPKLQLITACLSHKHL